MTALDIYNYTIKLVCRFNKKIDELQRDEINSIETYSFRTTSVKHYFFNLDELITEIGIYEFERILNESKVREQKEIENLILQNSDMKCNDEIGDEKDYKIPKMIF